MIFISVIVLFVYARYICMGLTIQGGCRGHDRMVVGFITTYAISA